MDIVDPSGLAAAQAIAVVSRAYYRVANRPQVSGSLRWSLGGDTSPLRIAGPDNQEQVALASGHRSEQLGGTTLTATFSPADGGTPVTASIALTVFSAEIHDAGQADTPLLDLGVGSRARYLPVVLPDIGAFDGSWDPGSNGVIGLVSVGPGGVAEVAGLAASAVGRDGRLSLSARVGEQEAKATLPIGVFAVRIHLMAQALDDLSPTGSLMGVGQTRIAQAEVLPADLAPASLLAWQWSVSDTLQALGAVNEGTVSFVANAPQAQAQVQVTLSFGRSSTTSTQALTVYGATITAEDDRAAPDALAVGAAGTYKVVIDPPAPEAEVLWTGSDRMTLREEGHRVQVRGVQASDAAGADGLLADVRIGEASTRALMPLTIYSSTICAADGGPAPTVLPVHGRQRFSVVTEPALWDCTFAWQVVPDKAALTGPTTERQVDVVTLRASDTAGDVRLGVSVVPRDVPHTAATAELRLTIGTLLR
ncbi:hypothetical protein [Piscinibacter terrae]|uniref:Uncharacterized protein n=1 Tax=Piscinibacter terrae TaxID=2496871 RepID=A0A3N7JSB1_9BURK|nr:hypothetical protein [Albitalea terrae]RQP21905.1 hypothetical protein DZC73_26050 [Albitalea terrae]